MAGYSGRPLLEKLGLKPGARVAILQAPRGYVAALKLRKVAKTLDGTYDFIHCFSRERKDLEGRFRDLKTALDRFGTLWISWPKKSSDLAGNLGESEVREVGLLYGLVDVKVCAVDDDWSALKFVYRLKDR